MNNNNQSCSLAKYPHVLVLHLTNVHEDYVEQFLDEAKTHLPRLMKLEVCYEQFQSVTENFTRNTTRFNCANIEQLVLDKVLAHSKDFYAYFPRLSSCLRFSWLTDD